MSIHVLAEALSGVKLLEPARFGDARGHFQEVFHREKYDAIGISAAFVQDNWSRSSFGTVRGLHYQLRFPQANLLQVITGRILDAVVDLRPGSAHFGQSYAAELSAENGRQLFVPEGFAHGFCVLSETADILYKCTDLYHPEDDRGILWNEPALGIEWPAEITEPILSDKDRGLPCLAEVAADQLPQA